MNRLQKNIYFVGMMGSGKSAIVRSLSKLFDVKGLDVDDLIEKQQGSSIKKIFDEKGEEYFRKLETGVLKDISKKSGFLIATGGGVVIREENLEMLKRNGVVFSLAATPEEIWKRVGHEIHRPLLQALQPLDRIRQMLAVRAPFYARANCIIHTTGLSIEEVTDQIIEVFQKKVRV